MLHRTILLCFLDVSLLEMGGDIGVCSLASSKVLVSLAYIRSVNAPPFFIDIWSLY